MSNGISDFIDLVGSGDEQMIKCVLLPALGGATIGGVALSATGLGAAIGAVLGGLGTYAVAYKACGAASTRGSFQELYSMSGLPKPVVEEYERQLMGNYGITEQQARYVTKVAFVYLKNGGTTNLTCGSKIEQSNALHKLLRLSGQMA